MKEFFGNKKKVVIASAALVSAVLLTAVLAFVLAPEFDAEGYVSLVLNQTYYGNVEGASEIIEGKTEEELYQQYEDGVTSFVKNNIISGVETDAETEAKFIELGKQIFGAMKFEITETEKISRHEYNVHVSYQPSDVFLKYIEYMNEESKSISKKVEDGEYKGTVDEINAQMKEEFMSAAYSFLEKAYNEMEYGEAQEQEFVVKVGASELYQVREDEIQKMMIKIMRLDEIQD